MSLSNLTECLAKIVATNNINCTSEPRNRTALHWLAMSMEGKYIGEILLAHGADPGLTDEQDQTPLELAIASGNNDLIQLLLGRISGDEITTKKMLPRLPVCLLNWLKRIHYWKNSFNEEDQKSLLDLVTTLEAMKLPEAKQVIHNYFRLIKKLEFFYKYHEKRQQAIVNFLISNFDLNQVDEDGNTPLHLAVDFDFQDFIVRLIMGGAMVDLLDNQGQPAVTIIDNGNSFGLFKGNSTGYYHYLRLRKTELSPAVLSHLNDNIIREWKKMPEVWEEIL